MQIWPWGTDKSDMVPGQANKEDGLTLGCYTWLETSWQTMQCEPVRCPHEEPMTFLSTIRVFFSDFFTELSKNLKVVMLINSLTFRNSFIWNFTTIRCSIKTLIIFPAKQKNRCYTNEGHGQTNMPTDTGGTGIEREGFTLHSCWSYDFGACVVRL